MPDLKFRGSKFYFSILNDSNGQHPLLLPIFNNPEFIENQQPPGIKQLLDGDLGITEKIMMPILDPIISTFLSNPLLSDSVASVNNLEKGNKDAIKSQLIKNYIPKDTGFKALEKTVIKSMMESYKPLMDFMKIFMEIISIAEDTHCKFLGTSIKILGKEIGLPSRNPAYWSEDLNYAETITHALKKFTEATENSNQEYEKVMSNNNPIKKNVPNGSEKTQGREEQQAYYVGYFDEDGETIEPPKWVLNSNKWFKREVPDINGNLQIISSPFNQLNPRLELGVPSILERQQDEIDKLQRDKNKMVDEIQSRIKNAENIESENLRQIEIDSLNSEKKESILLFDSLIEVIQDLIDGTNKGNNNYVDSEDKSKGINPPASLSEWSAKVKGAQLRQKYYPKQVSTAQSIIDKKGEGVEPYVKIPKVRVPYKGRNVSVDVPLAFTNQISTKKYYSRNLFFNSERKDNKGRKYSNENVVSTLDIFSGTSKDEPYFESKYTHFKNIKEFEYVPDNVKNYYLPMEWEEVFEYDIRNKRTGKIIKKEKDIVPFKIDIENDYELRLIKVVNRPLNRNGYNKEFFTIDNTSFINDESEEEFGSNAISIKQEIDILEESRKITERDRIRQLSPFQRLIEEQKGTLDLSLLNYEPPTVKEKLQTSFFNDTNVSKYKTFYTETENGMLFSESNNIPSQYNLDEPNSTKHSAIDINLKNNLKEGIIYQGLDPRFIDKTKYKTFWLVEAIKKDKRDIAPINNEFNEIDIENTRQNNSSDGSKGKEWYGLLDKYLAIPQIIIKLVPLISSKLIPMIVKIIQLVSNPTKIKSFLLEVGITDESVSNFPKIFKEFSKKGELGEIQKLNPNDIPKTFEEHTKKDLNGGSYYMGLQEGIDNPLPVSLIDGQALVEFGKGAFGSSIVDIGLEINGGFFNEIIKKVEQTDFTKPPPVKEQPIISFILSMMKLPLEIIFKIFKWIIDWVKKMLNPVKIPSAMKEFLSFDWLKDILGKDSIFAILGLTDATIDLAKNLTDNAKNGDSQDLFDETLSALRGGNTRYLEVLIYDIIVNGRKVRTERVERPYSQNSGNSDNIGNETSSNNGNTNNENEDNVSQESINDIDNNMKHCGLRFFNLNEILPIPFLPLLPSYNICETPIVFLKPLEMIVGLLKTIQEFINGCLSMPTAIFGLDPLASLPKFGQEIPFANILEDFLTDLKLEISQINLNG